MYQCQICGHEYDPKRGEPEQGIRPGIPFADLPENWTCPVCCAEKKALSEAVNRFPSDPPSFPPVHQGGTHITDKEQRHSRCSRRYDGGHRSYRGNAG
ncbi:MAG: rubredoxin [Methanomicrobiales archaeon]|nr:rubredoxin [Methanomicrobiales archaeon]